MKRNNNLLKKISEISELELYIDEIKQLYGVVEKKPEGLLAKMDKMLNDSALLFSCYNDWELAFLMSEKVYVEFLWITSKPYTEPLSYRGVKVIKDNSLENGQIKLVKTVLQTIYKEVE